MRLFLDKPLTGEDVTFINDSGIDYDITYLAAMAPQDLGWRDYETGAVLPTPNHRVTFNIRKPEEATFLHLRFTFKLKEVQ